MGLIVTDRHTTRDLNRWERLEEGDRSHRVADHKIRTARNVIAEWHDLYSPEYIISTSWGKDSTVLLHLAVTTLGRDMPEVRHGVNAKKGRQPNPDCWLVRTAFLDRWPLTYREVDCPRSLQRDLAPEYGGRTMTGIRAAESDQRRKSAVRLGPITNMSCRPILSWSHADVFAWLAQHNLPVHPAYAYLGVDEYFTTPTAMRNRIRVHSIGGTDGGGFRSEWEAQYYPDETALAKETT